MQAKVPKLRILVLGTPGIFEENQPYRIERRLLRALLFYLACQDEPVSRADLMLMFWPDQTEEEARTRLREALSRLRRELPESTMLGTDNDLVWLDREHVYVDFQEYSILVNQIRPYTQRRATHPLPESVYQQALKAVNLWRSPRFLSGANVPSTQNFDDWIIYMDGVLATERQNLIELLADHCGLSGDLETGVYWVRKAIEADEYNLDLYYRAISWLRELGRRSEALAYCQKARAIIHDQPLGAVPPALIALCEQIQRDMTMPVPPPPSPWYRSIGLQVPFVGREELLKNLKIALQLGGTQLIFGEAGSGKSRLVYELYQSLAPAPRILMAGGHFHDQNVPYAPLIDLLRHSVLPEEWQKLDTVWVNQLAVLLPELEHIRPGTTPSYEYMGEELRHLYGEAVFNLFSQMANHQRILFFLDDAQWCDADTFDVLAYLLDHKFFEMHGLLVIAARPEESNPALEHFLSSSQGVWMVHQIPLSLLDREEVGELTRYVLGANVQDAFVDRIARDTGGNPFFLLETLRSLLDQSFDPENYQNLDKLPLSSNIHSLVRDRLRLVSANSQNVLVTAGVVGNSFTADLLQAATQLDLSQVVSALEEMERVRIIRPNGRVNAPGEYEFIHDKVREVMILELSQARSQLIHLKVAKALEERAGNLQQQSSVIARHYEQAGEFVSAFQHWVKAGQYARQIFAISEAAAAFKQAEALLPKTNHLLDDLSIYQLYTEWAYMAYDQFDAAQAERIYAALQRIGEQRYSSLLMGSAMSGLARVAGMRSQAEQGLRYLENAIAYLEKAGHTFEMMEAYNRRGVFYSILNRFEEAIQDHQKVVALGAQFTETNIQKALAYAYYQLAVVNLLKGWPERALPFAEQSLLLSRLLYQSGYKARALLVIGNCHFYMGRYTEAEKYFDEAIQLGDEIQSWRLSGHSHVQRGHLKVGRGELDAAYQDFEIARLKAEQHANAPLMTEAFTLLGDIYRIIEDFQSSLQAYQMGANTKSDAINPRLLNETRLAYMLGRNGQVQEGLMLNQKVIDHSLPVDLGLVHITAQMIQAVLLHMNHQDDEALHLADQLEQESKARKFSTIMLRPLWLRGSIALRRGELSRAIQFGSEIIRIGEQGENPWVVLCGLRMVLTAQQQLGQVDSKLTQGLAKILHQITVQHPALRNSFDHFKTNFDQFVGN